MERIRLSFDRLTILEFYSVLSLYCISGIVLLFLCFSISTQLYTIYAHKTKNISLLKLEYQNLSLFEEELTQELDSVIKKKYLPISSTDFSKELNILSEANFIHVESTTIKVNQANSMNYQVSLVLSGSFYNLLSVINKLEEFHPFIHYSHLKLYSENESSKINAEISITIQNN